MCQRYFQYRIRCMLQLNGIKMSAIPKANDNKKHKADHYVELLLYDVLTIIFSHLTPEQLRIAAKVSKSWRNEAYKILSKRKVAANSVLLPTPPCECSIISHLERQCDVYDQYTKKIGFTPRFAIFFIDAQTETTKVYSHYGLWVLTSKPSIPESQYGMIIKSSRIYDNDKNLSGTSDNIAAFAIPESNNLIKIDKFFPRIDESPEEFVNRILPNGVENPCFMVFITHFAIEQTESIKEVLKDRYELNRFTLWGGCISKIILVSRKCEESPEQNCVWLRITGTSFRSWSVVLTWSMSALTVKKKLVNLKNKMELLAETVAFALVPTPVFGEESETMSRVLLFKKIFPNIRLKTILTHQDYHFHPYSFSVNSTEAISGPLLAHKYGISILIISSM